jgi:hypothetical protein
MCGLAVSESLQLQVTLLFIIYYYYYYSALRLLTSLRYIERHIEQLSMIYSSVRFRKKYQSSGIILSMKTQNSASPKWGLIPLSPKHLRRVFSPTTYPEIHPPHSPSTYAEFFSPTTYPEIHPPHSPTTYAEFLSHLPFLPIQRLTLRIPRLSTQSFAPPYYLSRG